MEEKKHAKTVKDHDKNTSRIRWEDLDHKKVFLVLGILLAVLILIVVLIVKAVSGSKEDTVKEEKVKIEESQQKTDTEDGSEDEDADSAEEENVLKVDAYEDVNTLVINYYDAIASGNMELVEQCVDVLTDEDRLTIEKKKDYIESYQNIICYTKKGLEDNSYVVFAAFDMKIYNIATPAPGIQALYVYENEAGELKIFYGEASEELLSYVLELEKEEEVAAVIADIDSRYQQLLTEDEDLGRFAEIMLKSQETETETDTPEEPQAEEEIPPAGETATEASDATALNKKMQLTDAVRIRADRSTDSEILKNAYKSEIVTAIESYSDGWSKVDYNGTVGYCKTEFLEDIRYE